MNAHFLFLAAMFSLGAVAAHAHAADTPPHIAGFTMVETKLYDANGKFLERRKSSLLPKPPVQIVDAKPELNMVAFVLEGKRVYVMEGQVEIPGIVCPETTVLAWIPPGRSNGAENAGSGEGRIGCVLKAD
ncbi:hypothetical protein [Asticcacaulis benevestitus]|uniref:Uncharacterized protein n=1 Tax=Asticcacaulis benevestitus DSM 16100 = ATCC BAA-896 TaxID=1121022 RepID=V4PIV1_9CAUL|nr:hypothetical protein [Asticcacaulis benevestitus]ESQ85340.1 hypothetical protein ABENE_19000 [Asticcacaulis benevestitus DSM 16100 = ATCC BAA-896]